MVNELLRRILFLPPQASTFAREIDYLHYFVILTTMLGAGALTVIGLVFVIRYRARGPMQREDPSARPPRWAEIGVIGGLLSLFCLWWAIGYAQYVKVQVPPENALTIYVTGKQWMWKFAYPSGEHEVSALYVPAGRPIKLLLTSRDVIHSFYVPDFRIKQDAVPGRYTTAWFEVPKPGTHLVMCTEYCGVGHSTMRAQVIVLAPEDYARWLAGARRGAEVPVPRLVTGTSGETTQIPGGLPGPRGDVPLSVEEFPPVQPLGLVQVGLQASGELGCLRCHTLDGSKHIGPSWGGLYRSMVPLADGGTVVADESYLTESMMDPAVRLHAGYQAVMPSYHGLMSPGQVAAILELIKSVRELPGRETARAPLAPLENPEAGEGGEPAGAMETAPVRPPVPSGARALSEPQGTAPPPDQRGLPPPGSFPYPPPRLPVRVGPPGAAAIVGPPDGGAP